MLDEVTLGAREAVLDRLREFYSEQIVMAMAQAASGDARRDATPWELALQHREELYMNPWLRAEFAALEGITPHQVNTLMASEHLYSGSLEISRGELTATLHRNTTLTEEGPWSVWWRRGAGAERVTWHSSLEDAWRAARSGQPPTPSSPPPPTAAPPPRP
jgi:hypothetical protein